MPALFHHGQGLRMFRGLQRNLRSPLKRERWKARRNYERERIERGDMSVIIVAVIDRGALFVNMRQANTIEMRVDDPGMIVILTLRMDVLEII
jgi:hypothetical protein